MSPARPVDRVILQPEHRPEHSRSGCRRLRASVPAVLTLAAAAWLALLPAPVDAQQRTLTIADIFDPARRVNFDGNAPFGLTWLDDRHYVERRSPRDAFAGPLVRVDALTGERAALYDVAAFEAAVAALPGLSAADAGRIARQSGHVTNADRTALIFDFADDLYHYDVGTERALRLTATPGGRGRGVAEPGRAGSSPSCAAAT